MSKDNTQAIAQTDEQAQTSFDALPNLEAGPELDALIEEKIFNQKWIKYPYVVINGVRRDVETWIPDYATADNPNGGCMDGQKPPPRSSDISLAWQVLEKFGLYMLNRTDHPDWQVEPYEATLYVEPKRHASRKLHFTARAETMPLAICRAALLATQESKSSASEEGK